MTTSRVPMPNVGALLGPILPALPPATVSTQPAIGVLPLLAPILRQRVQALGDPNGSQPWIRLLSYDPAKADRLVQVVQSGGLEPHPVSGEVEVDWEYDAKTKYRRLDQETLQALVVLEELELTFRLVYCVGNQDGGGDGWRLGEVGIAEKPSPFAGFEGFSTIAEADKAFQDGRAAAVVPPTAAASAYSRLAVSGTPGADSEDDDSSYWDRYDATPARSPAPAPAQVPAPPQRPSQLGAHRADDSNTAAEDNYFAQYDDVQPAMDNHDPDEEVPGMDSAPPFDMGMDPSMCLGMSTGMSGIAAQRPDLIDGLSESRQGDQAAPANRGEDVAAWGTPPSLSAGLDAERAAQLQHPRPASSASSNGSRTVEKLEETAERQGATELSVRTHVTRSIQSLYALSRSAGIDREEFERLVKTELDVYALREQAE